MDGQRIQGRDGVKEYLQANDEVRERIEQQIRDNAYRLMSPQSRRAAEATGRVPAKSGGVDVSAADFDED